MDPSASVVDLTIYTNKVNLPDIPLLFEVSTKGGYFLRIENPLNGEVIKVIPLKVKVKKIVPVAVRNLKAGTILSKEDFIYRAVLIDPSEAKRLTSTPEGMQLKIDLHKGQIIYGKFLKKPALRAGIPITLVFVKGNLSIRTSGTLLDNGEVGQKVRVRKGKKIFVGRLKDEKTVVVELP